MSAESAPYTSKIENITCGSCPLRLLTESALAEMAQGEEPYAFAEAVQEGTGVANGTYDVSGQVIPEAFTAVYDRIRMPLGHSGIDGSGIETIISGTDSEIKAEQPGYVLFHDKVVTEQDFSYGPKKLLTCLRHVKDGVCPDPKSSIV